MECGVHASEANLFHCLKTVLPKATEYTKGEVFTFITLGSLPLRESFLDGDVASLLQ